MARTGLIIEDSRLAKTAVASLLIDLIVQRSRSTIRNNTQCIAIITTVKKERYMAVCDIVTKQTGAHHVAPW